MCTARPVRLALLSVAVLLLAAVAAAVLSPGGEAEAGSTHTVEVSNFKFCTPAQSPCPDSPLDTTVVANVGDTISFQHVSGTHTASHCTDATFTDCSGNLFDFAVAGGAANNWLIPASVDGSDAYFRCNIHPSMQAVITVGNSGSPTASPSPSPAPTASPTASPSPSPAPTASPSPTPAPALSGRSDVNCDGATDGGDVLALLLHGAEAAPATTPTGANGCAPIGSGNGGGVKGDLNCDALVDARDGLAALLAWAGVPVTGLPPGCPGP